MRRGGRARRCTAAERSEAQRGEIRLGLDIGLGWRLGVALFQIYIYEKLLNHHNIC